jgi:hypothetical protein
LSDFDEHGGKCTAEQGKINYQLAETCHYTPFEISTQKLAQLFDFIEPWTTGEREMGWEVSNLRTLCRPCNERPVASQVTPMNGELTCG